MPEKFDPPAFQRTKLEKQMARLFERRAEREARKAAKAKQVEETKRRRERQRREAERERRRQQFRPGNGKAAVSRKLALGADKVLCARMAQGEWHTVADMRALMPEYAGKTVSSQAGFLVQRGWLDRAGNPDWDPADMSSEGQSKARYVYKVADNLAERVAEWRKELGG